MTNAERTPLEIVQLEVGLLENFCEVIGCPETGRAALLDPAWEVDRLLREAHKRQWTIEAILLTHTHDDHIAGLDEAAAETGAPVYCHPVEVDAALKLAPNVIAVEDRQQVPIGKGAMQALFTPGHMPGCVCWYDELGGSLITGDVLFVGSCGGVNYPQSDPRAMWKSLQQVLGALPESTRMYPGHAYGKTATSTLAWEFAHNPALNAESFEAFCAYKNVKPH